MSHWKILAATLLALALAGCGGEQETGEVEPGDRSTETAPEEAGREGPYEETPQDPEEMEVEPPEESKELWAVIQEEQSELTGEQQRTLQACAEIKIRDNDIAMEDAVQECRDEMEELAEEQQQEEEEEDGGEEEADGEEG